MIVIMNALPHIQPPTATCLACHVLLFPFQFCSVINVACISHISPDTPPPPHTHTLQVIRSLKHAMQPAVTGAHVTFDLPPGYRARVAPTVVPPIFIGERTIVYALLESSSEAEPSGGKATVTLQGHILGETVKHTLEVELQPLAESGGGFPLSVPTIHHLTGKPLHFLYAHKPGCLLPLSGEFQPRRNVQHII